MSGAVLRHALPSRPPTSTMAPKLSTDIQKKLLCFNSDLPRNNMEVWVTMEEMRDRLIHIGVDRVLSTEMVENAIKRVGRGLISRRRDGGNNISFYRPSLLDHECGAPLDQSDLIISVSDLIRSDPISQVGLEPRAKLPSSLGEVCPRCGRLGLERASRQVGLSRGHPMQTPAAS